MATIKIKKCTCKLHLTAAIKAETGKSLLECKNIVDTLIDQHGRTAGTLQLNRSSISQEQWERIVNSKFLKGITLEWEYV
jgi:hypothetical protein